MIEALLSDLGIAEDELTGVQVGRQTETPAAAAERLAADQEQVRTLIADGFQGPRFEMFRDEKWTFALRVMRDFLRTGKIMQLCAARGVQLTMSDHARRALHTSAETRDKIAVDTISYSFKYFCEEVLAKGKWRPDPGAASVNTYFIGACAHGFRKALREWEAEHREVLTDDGEIPDVLAPGLDPAERAALMDALRRILRRAKPEVRHICRLILQDLSHAEIAAQTGISEKAVEGHMYRLRAYARRLVRRGEIEPLTRTDAHGRSVA